MPINSLSQKRRAVFLDRDGTINEEVDHLSRIEDLHILPGAAQAIAQLNKAGFLVFITTNQSVVGDGLLEESMLMQIHNVLQGELAKSNASIDAIYYCPHHPEATMDKYRMTCNCRKPNTGMIEQATASFPIDLERSFVVGDMTADIAMGNRMGLTTILVKTGHAGRDQKHVAHYDFIADDLEDAVRIITNSA